MGFHIGCFEKSEFPQFVCWLDWIGLGAFLHPSAKDLCLDDLHSPCLLTIVMHMFTSILNDNLLTSSFIRNVRSWSLPTCFLQMMYSHFLKRTEILCIISWIAFKGFLLFVASNQAWPKAHISWIISRRRLLLHFTRLESRLFSTKLSCVALILLICVNACMPLMPKIKAHITSWTSFLLSWGAFNSLYQCSFQCNPI